MKQQQQQQQPRELRCQDRNIFWKTFCLSQRIKKLIHLKFWKDSEQKILRPLMFVTNPRYQKTKPSLPWNETETQQELFASVKLVKKVFSQKHLSMLRDMCQCVCLVQIKTVDVEGCWFNSHLSKNSKSLFKESYQQLTFFDNEGAYQERDELALSFISLAS